MILLKFFNLLLFARKNHFLSLSTTYLRPQNDHKCLFKINSLYKSKRWKLSPTSLCLITKLVGPNRLMFLR